MVSIWLRNHSSMLRQLVDLLDGEPFQESARDRENPVRGRVLDRGANVVELEARRVESVDADVEHAKRLLDHLGERAADRHHLADALHLAADAHGGALELGEVPARHLAHDVVERGLEERGRPPRDRVRDFGKRVADADLGGDVGERVAGRLAGQRARARQPRVDLDHPVLEAVGVERVLDVALADDAEMPDRSNRDRAEQLVLLVVQGLRGRDDDRLARVDAHRVEVLHVADRDAVVPRVADDLVLDLLPAAQALLDQHLDLRRRTRLGESRRRARLGFRRCRFPCRRARKRRASMTGNPISSAAARISAGVWQALLRAVLTPTSERRSMKRARSSVSRIDSTGVPSTCTPYLSSTPLS